jgi:hypothetical protein
MPLMRKFVSNCPASPLIPNKSMTSKSKEGGGSVRLNEAVISVLFFLLCNQAPCGHTVILFKTRKVFLGLT